MKICTVGGCGERHLARGLCSRHYQQAVRRTEHGFQQARYADLKKKYRLRPSGVEWMYRRQKGLCGICELPLNWSAPARDVSLPHVDHDHACCDGGRNARTCGICVRGLLCKNCNLGLGYFKDSIDVLEAAVDYLREHAPL